MMKLVSNFHYAEAISLHECILRAKGFPGNFDQWIRNVCHKKVASECPFDLATWIGVSHCVQHYILEEKQKFRKQRRDKNII